MLFVCCYLEELQSTASGQSSLPTNCGFNRQQTLYVIDLMLQHLEEESELSKNCVSFPKVL